MCFEWMHEVHRRGDCSYERLAQGHTSSSCDLNVVLTRGSPVILFYQILTLDSFVQLMWAGEQG